MCLYLAFFIFAYPKISRDIRKQKEEKVSAYTSCSLKVIQSLNLCHTPLKYSTSIFSYLYCPLHSLANRTSGFLTVLLEVGVKRKHGSCIPQNSRYFTERTSDST